MCSLCCVELHPRRPPARDAGWQAGRENRGGGGWEGGLLAGGVQAGKKGEPGQERGIWRARAKA